MEMPFLNLFNIVSEKQMFEQQREMSKLPPACALTIPTPFGGETVDDLQWTRVTLFPGALASHVFFTISILMIERRKFKPMILF